MITPEERKTLKVGGVIHTVVEELECVMSGEVIDNNTADFTFFTRSLDYEHIYIKQIDAYRTVRKMKLDDINYLNKEIELIDVLIKQLEQENGK
ncbi:hypothetical protein J3U21_06220 [Gilliamella sp. B2776]|uniref:hypothetical protein n=1 Tax=unclassified Gilliamella TaxID=2685620 RepID=UPI00226AD216|nr:MULTISPECIES: hypothetical protein [unclassified Gilliamella]MCX8649971.1 hypothetical protein [Gilliamella sp. B2779]MCX8653903.1 hypothetical protein [Gilliamella sp. B2737]MCX8691744.1 hypothetical protein [Gilliamella sp. B2776]MCX8696520.1 hypothetical protein [Gilliamella sp. B2828]MCX8701229.1 hypothetical protein [Gilliamella sp. B2840]